MKLKIEFFLYHILKKRHAKILAPNLHKESFVCKEWNLWRHFTQKSYVYTHLGNILLRFLYLQENNMFGYLFSIYQ